MLKDIPNFKCFVQSDEFSSWNLDQRVEFAKDNFKGTIHINTESTEQIHRAYLESELGRFPERPMIEMTIPSLVDASLAPEGHFVSSMFMQYYPRGARVSKEEIWANILRNMDMYAPGFSDLVLHYEILRPEDLEDEIALTGGHIFHGSMSLHSMFIARPFPDLAGYGSPIKNLWRCGAGTHPGGGVMGAPGRNCAQVAFVGK